MTAPMSTLPDYRDQPWPAVDVEALIRRGRRHAQRRAVSVVGAALVAVVAAALLVTLRPAGPRPVEPSVGERADQAFAARVLRRETGRSHPPVPGSRAVVTRLIFSHASVAWRADDMVCVVVTRTDDEDGQGGSTCWDPGEVAAGDTGPHLLGKPIVKQADSVVPVEGETYVVGFVVGDVARVRIAAGGRDVEAPVVPLGDPRGSGVYSAFVPITPTDPFDTSKITLITALDAAGRAVARTPGDPAVRLAPGN